MPLPHVTHTYNSNPNHRSSCFGSYTSNSSARFCFVAHGLEAKRFRSPIWRANSPFVMKRCQLEPTPGSDAVYPTPEGLDSTTIPSISVFGHSWFLMKVTTALPREVHRAYSSCKRPCKLGHHGRYSLPSGIPLL